MSIPTPPNHLFRPVKTLSLSNNKATYLCLPRRLEITLDHETFNNDEKGHSAAQKTHRALKKSKASELDKDQLKFLPQLFVVKMNTKRESLRKEIDTLHLLHEREDGDGSESFLGSWVAKEQSTPDTDSSWLCLRPIFGPSLKHFGTACIGSLQRGMPAYFVWHVFISLLEGLSFIHGHGIAHKKIGLSKIVIDPYPQRNGHRFRNYPNVLLIDFANTADLDEKNGESDVREMLEMVEYLVVKWSDSAPLLQYYQAESRENDKLVKFSDEIRTVLDEDWVKFTLEDAKRRWENVAVVQRAKGPTKIPQWISQLVHSDLATATELRKATKGWVTLNKFGSRKNEFREFARARRQPVALRKRTPDEQGATLLVLRFRFLMHQVVNLVGESEE